MKRRIFCYSNEEEFAVATSGGSSIYDVSTSVIPIIDVDAYGGTLSLFFYSSDMVILDDSIDAFWDQVVVEAMDIIQDSFNGLEIPAKVVPGSGSMYHPSYYNFECDELNFSISIENQWVDEHFEEYKDDPAFLNFIKEKYSSRSGFISFFPSTKDKFIEAYESGSDRWKVVCEMITYHIDDETYRDNSDELYETLQGSPNFDILYIDSSPSGKHSGYVAELIEDYKANPDSWDEYDVDWLRDYAKYEEIPFE